MLTERLFFALWPPVELQQAIYALGQQVANKIEGRPTPVANLHITLAFIGNVDSTTQLCSRKIAAEIKGSCFDLSLDKLGWWTKSGILWFGASQTPKFLSELVAQLNTRLQPCGYRPETRPYQAHITLFRDASVHSTLPPIPPVIWSVKNFCLLRSLFTQKGVQYQVIEQWPLD